MKNSMRRFVSLGAVVLSTNAAQALPGYAVAPIPQLDGYDFFNIAGLNELGQVLATHVNELPIFTTPAIWTAAGGHQLLTATHPYEEAIAINDLGQAVGSIGGIWQTDGSVTPLSGLRDYHYPRTIDNAGRVFVITGDINTDYEHPLIWQNGVVTSVPIDRPGAFAVNGANQLGVGAGSRAGINDGTLRRAITLSADGVTYLPNIEASIGSWAVDINDHGMVVGASEFIDATRHATVWLSDGSLIDLGADVYLFDVNNVGQVIGSGPDGPFLWSLQGGMELLPLPYQSEALFPLFINDAGQIVMSDWSDHPTLGYLLTPIPAPGACVILTTIFTTRRRR